MSKPDFLETAKEWHKSAIERYGESRKRQREDIRFAAASPDDPWQWDDKVHKDRLITGRPALTINKLPQHIRQVTNDVRQNRPAIRYRPVDDKADVESAEILMGIARHIEAHSAADVAYDVACENQVIHGEGFIRIVTEYTNEKSFDQEIMIVAVNNPFRVHLDPDRQDPVGSDARWCIIDDDISEDEYERQWPKADKVDWSHDVDGHWFMADKRVLIAEVFCIEEEPAKLLMWANGSTSMEGDPMPDGVFMGEMPVKDRKTTKKKVIWKKISGKEVLEEKEFACSFIPVVRVVGNEFIVDGKVYTSGLVRNAKDSQRIYNVAQSAIVERVMQAPKAPWAGPAEAFEGYEKIWQSANTANHAYLPYNHIDAEGNQLPAPQRVNPTTVEPGLNQVAMGAADDIKAETGQHDASMGARSNETSGKAIMARQREGDMATFHYVDGLGRGVRQLGKIILDMIPRIYDTQRVARILGEDGDTANVRIDPQSPVAMQKMKDENGEIVRIFNPNIGLYDVYASTGPSFTTKRVEAAEAMTAMVQANPQLMQVIGDQLVKNMDWPGADDMAERLKLTLLPQIQEKIKGEEGGEEQIPPQVKMAMDQMQQQMQQLDGAIQGMSEELQQKDEQARALQLKLEQEQSKRLKVENDLDSMQAVQKIKDAQAEFVAQVSQQQEQMQQVQQAPQAPQAPAVSFDVSGQLASVLEPVLMNMAESNGQNMQAIAAIADGQQRVMETIIQGQEQTQIMLAEIARPRAAQISIKKQPDGSFVGERIEG